MIDEMGLRAFGTVGRVLVVGGSPKTCDAGLLASLAGRCDVVVAVDHGLDALLEAGISCDLFCGDADSVGRLGADAVRSCERGEASPVRDVERYDPYKDHTDLSLALRAIRARWGSANLVCTCISGGRPDHALAALGCLLAWEGHVALEEDAFSARLLKEGESWLIEGCEGSTFSFVCLSETGVVSERGMEWELNHERVTLLADLGISNVITAEARISCHEGRIGAYLMR